MGFSSGYVPRSGIAGSYGRSSFRFLSLLLLFSTVAASSLPLSPGNWGAKGVFPGGSVLLGGSRGDGTFPGGHRGTWPVTPGPGAAQCHPSGNLLPSGPCIPWTCRQPQWQTGHWVGCPSGRTARTARQGGSPWGVTGRPVLPYRLRTFQAGRCSLRLVSGAGQSQVLEILEWAVWMELGATGGLSFLPLERGGTPRQQWEGPATRAV